MFRDCVLVTLLFPFVNDNRIFKEDLYFEKIKREQF